MRKNRKKYKKLPIFDKKTVFFYKKCVKTKKKLNVK